MPAVRLPRSCFSSQGLKPEEAFAIWDESISPLFNSSLKNDQEPFFVDIEVVDLGNLAFASTRTSQQQFHRGQTLCRKDQVDHLLLQLYTSGGYQGDNGKNKVLIRPNGISLLDLGYEVHTQAKSSHSLTVIIPRDMWLPHKKKAKVPVGATLREDSAMGYILGEHIKSVWHTLQKAETHDIKSINAVLLSVAQHCLSAAYELDDESDTYMGGATLKAIQSYILANLSDPELSSEKIRALFKCSRTYLYRLFGPWEGINTYIHKQRLKKCFQALTEQGPGRQRQITEIALSWGFNNQSHFSKSFKKMYGISPREARMLSVDLKHSPLLASRNTVEIQDIPEYRQWFLQL